MHSDKLDNPAWYALTETHHKFAIDYQGIKFYQPDYCVFGGFTDVAHTSKAIDAYASLTDHFYVISQIPRFSDRVQIVQELICNQMVLHTPITPKDVAHIVALNSESSQRDLFSLVNLVQPGYFRKKTALLGNYYGIYADGILVSAAGERMKMNEFTEISAIVTHPNYAGRGFASQLTAFVGNKIFAEDKTPYLHVAETNLKAKRLYEKLGFRFRRKISFWHFSGAGFMKK
ncbi:MAG TPA: GNAT family N-acetyltransferase [Ginsengibacter sp.]|nr:GNAT family N-acetyltransferase [Ginsengibacter sp.]HRP17937.1 GNAT family N-acetyltransferase [Ginsengibacter sp.]HRP45366.1 GNAT family N-acetyltransferase [Ginsengibacter sp.]